MTPLHRALLESLSDLLVASFRAAHQCTCGLLRTPDIPVCAGESASASIKEHFKTEPLHVNNPDPLAHVMHPKFPQELDIQGQKVWKLASSQAMYFFPQVPHQIMTSLLEKLEKSWQAQKVHKFKSPPVHKFTQSEAIKK